MTASDIQLVNGAVIGPWVKPVDSRDSPLLMSHGPWLQGLLASVVE